MMFAVKAQCTDPVTSPSPLIFSFVVVAHMWYSMDCIKTRGLEWHEKNAHGVVSHLEAFETAQSASTALIKHSSNKGSEDDKVITLVRLDPRDITAAQSSPEILSLYIKQGKVYWLTLTS
jgi:hypothetical protein